VEYYVATAFTDLTDVLVLAEAAEELGYTGIGVPDHVVNLETLSTPYPYTEDGSRRWPAFTPWPDPWVLIGAVAARTTRLRFVTSVYVAALRDPYTVAKAVSTAAVLAQGRVALGVGVGWSRDEFALLGAPFEKRGARTDEMIALLRKLWSPGWTEHDGPHFPTPRLEMEPTPPPIPVYAGGLSEAAYRRAARNDGWIADLLTTEQVLTGIARIREIREADGRGDEPLTVLASLSDAFLPEQFAAAEEGGVTALLTMPWAYYHGTEVTLDQKLDGLARFAADYGVGEVTP